MTADRGHPAGPGTAPPPGAGKERVTIAAIAAQAGVSVATVSKVLNGRDEVASATRERVQLLLDEAAYERRRRAAPKRAGLVDVVIATLDTPWAFEVLRGAEKEAHRLGASLILTVTHDRHDQPREWIKTLAARRTDGAVFVVSRVHQRVVRRLRTLSVPLVVVDPVGLSGAEVPSIGCTNWAGGASATEHLIELGHRRIAVIGGPPEMMCSQERIAGHQAALSRAGIPMSRSLVRHGDFYVEGGRKAAAALLGLREPPTAIFAGSDEQARGVYDEAHARGLRIPEDLSVVGFDDVDVCEWMSPRLTTVRQPIAQMAALAIRTVLQDPPPSSETPNRIELSTTLVVRNSTAPPSTNTGTNTGTSADGRSRTKGQR
jgi:LacI family transcriptional regulator